MPLLLSRNSEKHTLFAWEFTQNEEEFYALLGRDMVQKVLNNNRLHKRAVEKLGFFALLKSAELDLGSLFYDEHGKPFIEGGPSISYSHSNSRALLMVSELSSCGIDLEVDNEKILRIARKFMSESELERYPSDAEKYWIWSIKEAVFKYLGYHVDFRADMRMISLEENFAQVDYSGIHGKGIFDLRLEKFDEYKAAMTTNYEEKL